MNTCMKKHTHADKDTKIASTYTKAHCIDRGGVTNIYSNSG